MGFLTPVNINPMQIPGKTACDMASTMSAFLLKTTKTLTMPQVKPSTEVPIKTLLMFVS